MELRASCVVVFSKATLFSPDHAHSEQSTTEPRIKMVDAVGEEILGLM